jgi:hypothetical protein
MQNRIFFPQAALDQWVLEGSVDLVGNQLTILGEGRRYRIAEAVHVLREVSGTPDVNDIVGKVKSRVFFEELGAEVFESSMIIGENAYDVNTGWLGAPTSSFTDHIAMRHPAGLGPLPQHPGASDEFTAEPRTDEDLLARYLLKNM